MTSKRLFLAAFTVLSLALLSDQVTALINPNFTPAHLIKQSAQVVVLDCGAIREGKIVATVKTGLKGKQSDKTVTFDLSSMPKDDAGALEAQLNGGTEPAIFFVGDFPASETSGPIGAGAGAPGQMSPASLPVPAAGDATQKGFLHIGGTWVVCGSADGKVWKTESLSQKMLEVWRGATDMLIKYAGRLIEDPDLQVPSTDGAKWEDARQAGHIEGAVYAVVPVMLGDGGASVLHVSAGSGDRLFSCDKAKNIKDITADRKLIAKSKFAVWANFYGDGKLDLLSWDGESLLIVKQESNGLFSAAEKLFSKTELGGDCRGLAVVDCGSKGRPGVIISTAGSPLLIKPAEKAAPFAITNAAIPKELGVASQCLVADFNNDGLPDILQLCEKGSLLYKGKALGQWEAPSRCAVSLGAGKSSAFLGDFDGDGLLDVFTAGEKQMGLWSNQGDFKFVNTLGMSGEGQYNAVPGAFAGATGDINNDGWQDIALFYPDSYPRILFNRGFRCFGAAVKLKLDGSLLPEFSTGVQAGCWCDLNGDGAQDLVMIGKNGQLGVVFRSADDNTRCIHVALPPNSAVAGPLTVSGFRNGHCLGAWNVVAGGPDAFIGSGEAGPIALKWRIPGGEAQEKEVVLENEPLHESIGK